MKKNSFRFEAVKSLFHSRGLCWCCACGENCQRHFLSPFLSLSSNSKGSSHCFPLYSIYVPSASERGKILVCSIQLYRYFPQISVNFLWCSAISISSLSSARDFASLSRMMLCTLQEEHKRKLPLGGGGNLWLNKPPKPSSKTLMSLRHLAIICLLSHSRILLSSSIFYLEFVVSCCVGHDSCRASCDSGR